MSGSEIFRACSWTLCLLAALTGCGTTKSRLATEQLLMSDAVDRSVSAIDFSPLAGKPVYFDTKYMVEVKGLGFVNAQYLISSLRQQMLAAGCLLQEKEETAEVIIEGRCGTLGADGHEVTYGMPASSGLTTVASMLPNAPPVPAIPEIAIAKRQDNRAAAKIGLFAYHRESRLPVWQSGVSVSSSDAKDVWVFGAGPFQNGAIYDGTQFAGGPVRLPTAEGEEERARPSAVSYFHEMDFERQRRVAQRRRQQALEEAERLAEIPELMPLTQRTFGSGSVARRLPPVANETAEGNSAEAASAGAAAPASGETAPAGETPAATSETPAAAGEAPAGDAAAGETIVR